MRASRPVRALAGLAALLLTVACTSRPSSGTASSQPAGSQARSLPGQQSRASPRTSVAPPAPQNVYAHTLPGDWAPATRGKPYLVYAPDSQGSQVVVIDPSQMTVIRRIRTAAKPQHVVPAWDLQTLYATDNAGNSLTPIDPSTGDRAGPDIPVPDPYNLYFTPDGRFALVVEEARQILSFRDPHTFEARRDLHVSCPGVDHLDFSADGSFLVASCEFSGRLVRVDLRRQQVTGYLQVGGSPQDVKLSPDGNLFWVADMHMGGVRMIDATQFRQVGFIATGADAHGLYVSRDTRLMYVTNRRGSSISVIDFAARKLVRTWLLPGKTPDMGNVSPDGTVLWLGGRYTGEVYAVSTADGHLIAAVRTGGGPHGVCVWPQPGRYSTGHTGVMR